MSKRYLNPIEDERITLRLLEEADLPLTLSWRNRDDIRKWFINPDIIPEEKHYAWFERYRELDKDYVFIILAKELGNLPVGQISLYNVDWNASTAEYGRLMIGEAAAKGKGFAKAATRLVLYVGFQVLDLREIHLEVYKDNVVARKIYNDCGFLEVGRNNSLIRMNIKK